MDIYINERSFVGQTRSYNLVAAMALFAETIGVLQRIAPGTAIIIHSSLADRQLTDTLTLREWLFSQEYRDAAGEEETPLQALIGVVRAALFNGPHLEDDLDASAYLCCCGDDDDVGGSAIDGAAQRGGLLVSFPGCAMYADGPLVAVYEHPGERKDERPVTHFVSAVTARQCRRRYVPNPKHHPGKAKGNHSPMQLDRAYDLFTAEREQELRDPTRDPWDTEVQRLLDRATPGGKQLYARVWDPVRRLHVYYEFKDDNMNGFHGYPVPSQQVPPEVVRRIEEDEQRRAA